MPATIRCIHFAYYDGLAHRVLDDIRSAEDALIAKSDQQSRRDALYGQTRVDLQERFRVGESATLPTPSQAWQENPANPQQLIIARSAPGDPADESVIISEPRTEEF